MYKLEFLLTLIWANIIAICSIAVNKAASVANIVTHLLHVQIIMFC